MAKGAFGVPDFGSGGARKTPRNQLFTKGTIISLDECTGWLSFLALPNHAWNATVRVRSLPARREEGSTGANPLEATAGVSDH